MTETELHVDVAPLGLAEDAKALAAGSAILCAAALSFSARLVLCQLQAYVLLALCGATMLAYTLRERYVGDYKIEVFRGIWCLDIGGEAIVGVTGRAIERTGGVAVYRRLHPFVPRVDLVMALWLVWIAYGAVFDAAAYQPHSHDSELIARSMRSFWAKWNAHDATLVVELLRSARRFGVACCALLSLAVGARRTARKVADASHTRIAVAFAALLFFPTSGSVAQLLGTLEVVARTHLFVALFAVSERLAQERRYLAWIDAYSEAHVRLVGVVLMAVGKVEPRAVRKRRAKRLDMPLERQEPVATRLATVVQSAWILFADSSVVWLALLQLVLSVGELYRLRKQTLATIKGKNEYFVQADKREKHEVELETGERAATAVQLPQTGLHQQCLQEGQSQSLPESVRSISPGANVRRRPPQESASRLHAPSIQADRRETLILSAI